MPPRLKEELVKCTLRKDYDKTRYYFNDYKYDNKAPFGFVMKVLTNLHCAIFLEGNKLIEFGKPVYNLNIFMKGSVNLYGYGKLNGEEHRVMLSRLPVGSWYGDYQILMNTNSNFDIEAGHYRTEN